MRIAWVFPGQGSQVVGMGKALAAESAAARAVFERADEALGEKLSTLCFEGPIATLTLTANTQPAILTTSMAVLAALRERIAEFPVPECAAGHSLGEYSALCAAGSLSLEDAVRVCRARGLAMQDAVAPGLGAMAAVLGVEDDALEAMCAEARGAGGVVSPANFNAPGQTVIAGDAAAVERAGQLVKAHGGKLIPLNVSAPFHCALMAPACRHVALALGRGRVDAPTFDVFANVDAAPKSDPIAIVDALAPGSDWQSLVEWTISQDAARVAWVGHAPCVGRLAALTIGDGSAAIRMTKGAVASIRLDDGIGHPGELEWLATAALLES